MNRHPFVKGHRGPKVILKGGYVVDRRLSWGLVVVTAIILFMAAREGNFDFSQKVYAKCEGPLPCDNPLYGRCNLEVCSLKVLPPGYEGGVLPGWWWSNSGFLTIGAGIAFFFLNHFLYNRKFELQEAKP